VHPCKIPKLFLGGLSPYPSPDFTPSRPLFAPTVFPQSFKNFRFNVLARVILVQYYLSCYEKPRLYERHTKILHICQLELLTICRVYTFARCVETTGNTYLCGLIYINNCILPMQFLLIGEQTFLPRRTRRR
jgi:hypothetical protein